MKTKFFTPILLISFCILTGCSASNTESDQTQTVDFPGITVIEVSPLTQRKTEIEKEKEDFTEEQEKDIGSLTSLLEEKFYSTRFAHVSDEEINSLERKDADFWNLDFSAFVYSFPSMQEIENTKTYFLPLSWETENVFSEYVNNYCDIWDSTDFSIITTKNGFYFQHGITAASLTCSEEGEYSYFVIENAEFDPQMRIDVNEDLTFYQEESKTLYLFLEYSCDYEAYNLSPPQEAVSNRCILTLCHSIEELPVSEVVIVLP